MAKVEKDCHEARDVERTKAITGVKVELANKKEAWRTLEGQASVDRLALGDRFKDRHSMQKKLTVASAKL